MINKTVIIIFLIGSFMLYGSMRRNPQSEVACSTQNLSAKDTNYTLLSEKEYMRKVLEDEVGKHRYIPNDGYVPNEETAKKIAEAVWFPIYGERINEARPFEAYLVFDSIWVVMAASGDGYKSTPHIEIKKSTGEILFVMYYK